MGAGAHDPSDVQGARGGAGDVTATTRPDLAVVRSTAVVRSDAPDRTTSFGVLGQVEVRDDGTPVELGGRRQQLVLAVLLDRANQRVSVDRLIDAVWGEAPPLTSRKTLQAYVSRLRRIVGGEVIETVAEGYRITVDHTQLDALRFELLAGEGEARLEDAPAEAADSLRDALALWRGAPYGALGHEPALRASTNRLLDRRLEVLENRVTADLACGNDAGLTAELEALVSDHPLRENLHRLRMLALYRAGRQAEALDAAQQLRTMLADELGLEPSPAVQQLQQRILRQDRALLHHGDAAVAGPPDRARSRAPAPAADTPTHATSPWTAGSGHGRGGGRSGGGRTNPYRGLRPFAEGDADVFFGRLDLTAHLLARVAGEPLTTVVGPSGSGKSSVVRAGLLPAVRAEHPDWLVATMTPGARPFSSFQAALRGAAGVPTTSLADQLRGDDLDVLRAVQHVTPEDARLLLVVDQLEELFLLAEPAVRDRFAQGLVEAVDDPHSRLTVIGTIRADFLDGPLRHSGFGPYVEPSSVLVPPLSPSELEAATVGPARSVGVAVAPELVAQLVADVASEPAALPLFQYTMTELFDSRGEGPLTLSGYHRLGGLRGALTSRADELVDRLSPSDREVARQVLLRLVTLGEGTEDTRRRTSRAELDQLPLPSGAVDRVLRAFGDARLLVFDRDAATGGATVEVAHEALLDQWPVLVRWIDDARADLRMHRTLSATAAEWAASGEDEAFLLSGGRLASVDEWQERSGLQLTTSERRFLGRSRGHAAELDRLEEERRVRELDLERRAGRRLRGLVAVLTVAAMVAGGLAIAASRATDAAEVAEADAERGETLARAGELAARSTVVARTDAELGMLLALHAVRVNAEVDGPLEGDVMAALHWTLQLGRVPYGETDAEVLVVEGPDRPLGIYALPADQLVRLVRDQVDRELAGRECLDYLGDPTCPPPLPVDLGVGLTGEQPRIVATPADAPLAGTTVRVFGGVDSEAAPWVQALIDHVRDATGGVELELDSEEDFDELLTSRGQERGVDALVVAQPSRVPELATTIGLQDVTGWVDSGTTSPHLASLGRLGRDGAWPAADGPLLAVPYDTEVKALVWYRPSVFAEAGYVPPRSYDELLALVRRMVQDGRTPWCLGYESGSTSGWPGTDVVEALVLGDLGPAGYDAWVRGDLRFQSPEIRRSFTRYAELMLAPGHATGIVGTIPNTSFFEAGFAPFLDGRCLLSVWFHWPATTGLVLDAVGTDREYFHFPATTAAGAGTVLASGLQLVALTDRPEVRAVVDALYSPTTAAAITATAPDPWLSPNVDFDPSGLGLDPLAEQVQRELTAAVAADTVRFDGSDLMPEVVWRAFNAGMVTLVEEGPDAIDGVLADIDEAWDAHDTAEGD